MKLALEIKEKHNLDVSLEEEDEEEEEEVVEEADEVPSTESGPEGSEGGQDPEEERAESEEAQDTVDDQVCRRRALGMAVKYYSSRLTRMEMSKRVVPREGVMSRKMRRLMTV